MKPTENERLRAALSQVGKLVADSGGICDQQGWYVLMDELADVVDRALGQEGELLETD